MRRTVDRAVEDDCATVPEPGYRTIAVFIRRNVIEYAGKS